MNEGFHMEESSKIPPYYSVEVGGEKVVYYPVSVDESGRKKILDLPPGENPTDYEIELATREARDALGGRATNWVAVKATPEVERDRSDWDDQGGGQKSG